MSLKQVLISTETKNCFSLTSCAALTVRAVMPALIKVCVFQVGHCGCCEIHGQCSPSQNTRSDFLMMPIVCRPGQDPFGADRDCKSREG